MKKILIMRKNRMTLILMSIVVVVVLFSACGKNKVEGVKVNPSETTLQIGENITIAHTVIPENADDKLVRWEVDKPEIVDFDAENGIATAKAEGIAIITCITNDGGFKATSKITVIPVPDYRDPFTGTFDFTAIERNYTICDVGDDPDCIDGWKALGEIITHFRSEVLKIGSDSIKIHFMGGYEAWFNTIFPTIDETGLLTYTHREIHTFAGSYNGYDTVNIYLREMGMLGGYGDYEIQGIRVDD